jgi:YegS/Rv2252/BmrU family lipid kinase
MSTFVVVNPHSAGGRTGHDWKSLAGALKSIFPDFAFAFTRHRGDAPALVRKALSQGFNEIIAVGGDGTINEAVNGLFGPEGSTAADVVFGFITSGTGGDFRKSFTIDAGARESLARLASGHLRRVDVGRLTCLSHDGTRITRHFVNIASFGLSGLVIDSVNRARISKLFGGTFAFAFNSLKSMLFFQPRGVRLILDNGFDQLIPISLVAIANGRYFGGGMHVAPEAEMDDGLFDVIVMGPTYGRGLLHFAEIYSGEHLKNTAVQAMRAHKVIAAPVGHDQSKPVLIETDGESAGMLPATFEILPKALHLRC